MKKLKQKLKKFISVWYQVKVAICFIGIVVWACFLLIVGTRIYEFTQDPAHQGKFLSSTSLSVPKVMAYEKEYKYNDKIPVEVVKYEIRKQAEEFGNDVQFMLKLAFDESGYNNLADNPTSTAKGIYQFVALTWEPTESNKNKISEFDYKANIREANIKIANEEYSHWEESLN